MERSPIGQQPVGAPKHGASPRGMGRIVAFFAIAVAVLFVADWMVNTGLRRIPTSTFGLNNRIVRGEINAQILITGSSRAQVHYDPRIIQEATGLSTHNIGINGSQTDMQVAMLRTYLKHNRPPQYIVHNLDLYSLQISKEIYDPAQYLPYLGEEHVFAAVSRVYPDAWKWKWLPLYGYATQDLRFTWLRGFRGLVGSFPAEDLYSGFMPRQLSWTDDFEKLRANNPNGITFEVQEAGREELEAIGKLARDCGAKLIFVYSPEYIEMQAIERNRSEIFTLFRQIAERYGAALWDYSDSSISKSREYFYNSQHLNARGADEFTRSLAVRLKQMLLSGSDFAK